MLMTRTTTGIKSTASPFQTMKRQQQSSILKQTKFTQKRAYSSEMANALVQVSQNLGMGSAAIGLGGMYYMNFSLPSHLSKPSLSQYEASRLLLRLSKNFRNFGQLASTISTHNHIAMIA